MRNASGYFMFFILMIILLIEKLIFGYNHNESYVLFLKIQLISSFMLVYIYTVKKSGFFSTFSIFLATSFLFLYSRFLLDILGVIEIEKSILFSRIILSEKTMVLMMESLLFSLLFSFLAFLLFYSELQINTTIGTNIKLENASMFMMYILAPFIVIEGLVRLYFAFKYGYISFFTGAFFDNIIFRLLTYISRVYMYIYFVFLSTKPSERNFKKVSILFIILTTLNMLSGQRGKAIILFLIVIWYAVKFYSIKIKLNRLMIIAGSIIFLSQIALLIRSDFSKLNLADSILGFFEINGISVYVLGYIIELKDVFINDGLPYFLSPIQESLLRVFGNRSLFYSGNTMELLQNTNYLARELTYFINPTAYINGNSTGTSYIAEFYSFGKSFGVSILSFLSVSFVLILEKHSQKKRIIFAMFFSVLYRFIYMPRDSLLKFIFDLFPIIVTYFCVGLLAQLIRYEKPGGDKKNANQ